ncbi:MAG: hypothetical protein HY704_06870, partial [Gemmatimonadetes bacterium]|nr:hypothetical protein [Gemmatimonadota bacterium]
MWNRRWSIRPVLAVSLVVAFAASAFAQQQVPHPKDVFGFEPGADYKMADYTQVQDYLRKLDA